MLHALGVGCCLGGRKVGLPQIVISTDPGPDPDDIKTILILAMLHKQSAVSLRAVICSGGQQPEKRAALGKCLLNHLGESNVPVGIGSRGKEYSAQPHEYLLEGHGQVREDADLVEGHALLMQILREARPKSLTMVCVASLRDFADAMLADPDLFVAKVAVVAIQGGLERDDEDSPWRPDTSVNNMFDIEGAAHVYQFCFERGVPMTVTSRLAVPLLPMQLARSFAESTNCPVMTYLANAQFLGLKGLWQKLCEGKLPARCNKQWYFETFCGINADHFAAKGYDTFGAEIDIAQYLNGFVKPYDVLALMTVLPLTRTFFNEFEGAQVVVNGVSHLLLLNLSFTIPVSFVINLLRDIYVEVVQFTVGGDGPLAKGRGQRKGRDSIALRKMHPVLNAGRLLAAHAAEAAKSHEGHHRRTGRLPSTTPSPSLSKKRSNASDSRSNNSLVEPSFFVNTAGRRSSVRSEAKLSQFFEKALAEAIQRQARISRPAAIVGITCVMLAVAAMVIDIVYISHVLPYSGYDHDDHFVRTAVYQTVAYMAISISLLALHPTRAQACYLRTAALTYLFFAILLGCSDAANATQFFSGAYVPGYPRASKLTPILLVLDIMRSVLCSAMLYYAISRLWGHYRQLCRLVYVSCALFVGLLTLHTFARVLERLIDAEQLVNGRPEFLPVLALSVVIGTASSLALAHPRFRPRAQGWLAKSIGSAGRRATIAPLLGFGTEDRDPKELISEASRSFNPIKCTDIYLSEQCANDLQRGVLGRLRPPNIINAFKNSSGRNTRWSSRHSPSVIPRAIAVSRRAEALSLHGVAAERAGAADLYIVHSMADNSTAKCAALANFAREWGRRKNGDKPTIWLDSACAPPLARVDQLLSFMPVHMSKCRKLVLLWGPTLVSRTWCICEILCWYILKGTFENVVVLPVVRVGPEHRATDLAAIIASVDTFHLMHAQIEYALRSERITLMLEIATVAHVNAIVRGFYPTLLTACSLYREPSDTV
mmetsp:Transcript_1839/g.4600  ORF Transcript_1839/g.4600 Transcript_1839/m.4600 type:complete len:996 (-) Transcript_1839:291-3278(-)